MADFPLPGDAGFEKMVEKVAARLKSRGWKLATAESCTGGWIAKCCTDLAGSSAWFERGFVTYSNPAKIELLGVDPAVLTDKDRGAVSRETALQMARGACHRAAVDVALAVTGVAGPDGGTDDKPVGTVWLAWSLGSNAQAELKQFSGDRDAVRRQTVTHALQGLLDRIA